ncbi:hypothetical protein VaNZ11_014787, partial [Volvox africanus]
MPIVGNTTGAGMGCITSRIDVRDAVNGQAQKHRDDCYTPGTAADIASTSQPSKVALLTLPGLLSPIAPPTTAINPIAPHTTTYMPHKPTKRRLNLSSPLKPQRKSGNHDDGKASVKGHRTVQAPPEAVQIPTRTACGFCVKPDPVGLCLMESHGNVNYAAMAKATSHSSGIMVGNSPVAEEVSEEEAVVAITHPELNLVKDGMMAADGVGLVHARRPVRESVLPHGNWEGGGEHKGDEQWQSTLPNHQGKEGIKGERQRGHGSNTASAAVTSGGGCTDRPVRKAAAKARQRIMINLKAVKKVGQVLVPLRSHAENDVAPITIKAAASGSGGYGAGMVSRPGSSSVAAESSGWSPEVDIELHTQHTTLVDGTNKDAGGDSGAADAAGRRAMGVIPANVAIILGTDLDASGDPEGYLSATSKDDDEHGCGGAEVGPQADRSRGTHLSGTSAAATSGHSSGAHGARSDPEVQQQQQLQPELPGWDPRRPGYVELSEAVEYRQARQRALVKRPEDLPQCWGVGLLGSNLVVCNTVLRGSASLIFQEARKAALQGRLWKLESEALVQIVNDDERLTFEQAKALTHQFEERLRKAAAEHMTASVQPWQDGAARKDWRSLTHAEVLENLPELIRPSGKVEAVILGERPDDPHPWEDVPEMTGQASLRTRPGNNLAPGEFIGLYSAEAWLHPDWQAQILANPMDHWDDSEYPCPYRFSANRKHDFGSITCFPVRRGPVYFAPRTGYAADCSLPEKLLEHLDQLDLQDERLRTQLQEEPENCGKMFLTSARLGCMMSAANDPRRNLRAMCEAEAHFREGGPNAVVMTAVISGILPVLVMVATSHIAGGQHVMYSYGPAYWNLHEEEQSVCRDLETVWNELRKARAWKARRQQWRDLKCRLAALTHRWEETRVELQAERELRLAAEEVAANERQRRMEIEEELRALRAALQANWQPVGPEPQCGHEGRKPQPTPLCANVPPPCTSLGDLESQETFIMTDVAEPAVGGAMRSEADGGTESPEVVLHGSGECRGKMLLGSPLGKRARADTRNTIVDFEDSGMSPKTGGVTIPVNDGGLSGVDSSGGARRALAACKACGPSVTSTTTIVVLADAVDEAPTSARRYSRLSLRREGKAMLGEQGGALDATNAYICGAAAPARVMRSSQQQLMLDVGGSAPGIGAAP